MIGRHQAAATRDLCSAAGDAATGPESEHDSDHRTTAGTGDARPAPDTESGITTDGHSGVTPSTVLALAIPELPVTFFGIGVTPSTL